jgi:tape measure domain-containing protein
MALGKLNLKLGIDVSDLDKELGKVERSMSRFGGKMQNIGTTLTQSLTLPIIGLGAASLKSFADIEKLQNGLIAIMGSSEDAAVEMEKLRKVAENPGLALPEVVKASASLQSVGMNADAARETITQFGNAVARAGKGPEVFDGVITALGQISAVGQITQEDLNQIKERLPEFAKVMKQEFGVVTAEALRDAGISSEEFIQRSVGALGNLERANGGLANTFDNLKDNVGASLAELGKSINETLNLESVVATLSAGLQRLVDGFKSLNPETQGFIVKAGLLVAALGPAIFIVGKLISTFGALIGTTRLIMTTVKNLSTVISGAFAKILANPAILGVTLAIAAVGAIALYVYDNWKAFSDNFKNIWINIKNSVMQGVTFVLGKLDNLQKALGLDLFDLSGMTKYQEEQRVVASEFKTIGETVDSLKGKFKSLFMAAPGKGGAGGGTEGTGPLVFGDGGAPTGGGTGGSDKVVKSLFQMQSYKTLGEIAKAKEELDKAVLTDIGPKIQEQLGLGEKSVLFMKNASADIAATYEKLKTNPPELAKPFTDAQLAMENFKFTVVDAVTAATDAFSNMAMQGETDMKKLGTAALQAARTIISAYIKEGVAGIIKNILAGPTGKALGPIAIAVAGAAGAGAAVLFNTMLNKVAAPKLAQGGLAYGPTMATVGDNRNARVDPEVIAPLSKLKSMMGDMGIGGTLETRISGNDLIILLNRSQKGLNRVQ